MKTREKAKHGYRGRVAVQQMVAVAGIDGFADRL